MFLKYKNIMPWKYYKKYFRNVNFMAKKCSESILMSCYINKPI